MKSIQLLMLSVFVFVICFFSKVSAGVIDFETLPNGNNATDNIALGLSDAYFIDGVSITFGFDSDNDGVTDTQAILEQVGGSDTTSGFLNDVLGQRDTADPGFESQLGNYFLRKQGTSDFGTLIIDYSSLIPVTAASGEIWDIDGGSLGNEQYRIAAYDSSGILLDTIISPLGNDLTLDGRPFTFGFSGLSDINQIRIDFISAKSSIGLAFNNFYPGTDVTTIPTPSSILLCISGLASIFSWRHKKK